MALRGVACEASDILEPNEGDEEMLLLPSLPQRPCHSLAALWSLWAEALGEVKPATCRECSLCASVNKAPSPPQLSQEAGVLNGPHCPEEVMGTEVKLPVQGHITMRGRAPRPVLLTVIPPKGKKAFAEELKP